MQSVVNHLKHLKRAFPATPHSCTTPCSRSKWVGKNENFATYLGREIKNEKNLRWKSICHAGWVGLGLDGNTWVLLVFGSVPELVNFFPLLFVFIFFTFSRHSDSEYHCESQSVSRSVAAAKPDLKRFVS